ncbi:universal stress protein [Streptomyces sp. ADMS]|uniref:universal stress protein n=1 Tax=Streptomyces sp. ADMS TaxID=3071415 RepID=UPI00296EDF8D|nr:universal stress protein [Streptomyces sp. ADMS]MDW4904058.1 universal stress protein [Streptomyces sp. ADMS]
MEDRTAGDGIVVGIDGSGASMAALRWAAEQARALHTHVVAVHAWEPKGFGLAPYARVPTGPTHAEQRVEAARLLASTVRKVFGPRIDDSVRAVVVEGPPARMLLEQTSGAVLLALGHKTHEQDGLPAFGMVGRACLRGAKVPVVAVPATERHTAPLRVVSASRGSRRGAA